MNGKYVIWHTGYIKGINFAQFDLNMFEFEAWPGFCKRKF